MIVEFSKPEPLFAADASGPSGSALAAKLESFATLPIGWHFGEGAPVSTSAINTAKDLSMWAAQLALQADAFPGLDGECMVAFYNGDGCVRVIVYPDMDDSFGLRIQSGRGARVKDVTEPKDNVTRWEAYNAVIRLVENEWSSRAHSTSESSTILASARS